MIIIYLTKCVMALSNIFSLFRTGVRAAVDWLFIRVQNSRRCVFFLKSIRAGLLLKFFSCA